MRLRSLAVLALGAGAAGQCTSLTPPTNAVVTAALTGGVTNGADVAGYLSASPGYSCSGTATAVCAAAGASATVTGTYACTAISCTGVAPPVGATLRSDPGVTSTGASLAANLLPQTGYSCSGTATAVCLTAGAAPASVTGYTCTGNVCAGGIAAPAFATVISDLPNVATGTDVTTRLAPVTGYTCQGRATALCTTSGTSRAGVQGYSCSPAAAAGGSSQAVLCSGPFFCPVGYQTCRGCAACAACAQGVTDCCAATGAAVPAPVGGTPVLTLTPTTSAGAAAGPLRVERQMLATATPACVTAIVRVWDSAARPVPGLTADHFTALEAGAEVSPSESHLVVSAFDQYGFSTMLLLDLSRSVTSAQLPSLKRAVLSFIASVLGNGRTHEVGIWAFDGRMGLQQVSDFSSDKVKLEAAVRGIVCGDGRYCVDPSTDLNGAVVAGSQMLADRRAASTSSVARSFLVVFSDGSDQAKRVTDAAAVAAARSGGHRSVYTVGLGSDIDVVHLRNLASDGGLRQASSADGLGAAFTAVAQDIHLDVSNYYRVDYCSPARDGALEQQLQLRVLSGTATGSLVAPFSPAGFTYGCDARKCAQRALTTGSSPQPTLGLVPGSPPRTLDLVGTGPPVPPSAGATPVLSAAPDVRGGAVGVAAFAACAVAAAVAAL